LPPLASTHSPLMKFLYTRGAAAVAILPPQAVRYSLGGRSFSSDVPSQEMRALALKKNLSQTQNFSTASQNASNISPGGLAEIPATSPSRTACQNPCSFLLK